MPPRVKQQEESHLPTRFKNSLECVNSLPHRSYERAQLLLFVGKRGHGKTYALERYIEEAEPRVFILDPFGDFKNVRMRESIETAMAEMRLGIPLRRRVVPPIDEASIEYAEKFFKLAVEHLRNCLIVLDEVTLWSDSHECKALRTLILQGRRLGLRFCVATQRLSLVPGVFLSECTELLVFRTTRPRDLVVLDDWAGKDVSTKAPRLEVGECFLVSL